MSKEIESVIRESLDTNEITLHDIPDLDLYVDQIVTLVDNILKENKRSAEEKLLTKTMINNYSKARVIKPIKGKKYSKLQIIQILITYSMKNTLTIEEIKRVLNEHEFTAEEISRYYQNYLDKKALIKTTLPEYLIQNGLIGEESDPMETLLIMTALSTQSKRISESIIDHYYPEISKKKEKNS